MSGNALGDYWLAKADADVPLGKNRYAEHILRMLCQAERTYH